MLGKADAHGALDRRQAHIQLSAAAAGVQHQLQRERRRKKGAREA